MTRAARTPSRDDRGATTVVFAVVVLLLFAFAALGVEITSMYARDRAVQTVADVTALAAAQDLPDACAAVATALRTLTAEGNAVPDDDGNAVFGVTGGVEDRREPTPAERSALATQLSDRDLANGEVQVLEHFGVLDPENGQGDPPVDPDDPAWLSTAGCRSDLDATRAPSSGDGPARFVRVVVPSRTVRFTFANAFSAFGGGSAPAAAEVRAVATAGILAPKGASILPIATAQPCPGGSSVLLTDVAAGSTTFDPPGSADGPSVTGVVLASDPGGQLPLGSEAELRVGVSGLLGDPADAVEQVLFDVHHGARGLRVELRPTAVTDVVTVQPSVEPSVQPTAEPSVEASVESNPAAEPTQQVAAAPIRDGSGRSPVVALPAPSVDLDPSVEPSTGATPSPTVTRPTEPDPSQPDPTEPEPTELGPTETDPSGPVPSEPDLSEPGITEPEPTEPAGPSTYSATFVVTVDESVTAVSGTWNVRARQPAPAADWSPDAAVGTVTVAGSGLCAEVGLLSTGSTGDASGSGVDLTEGLVDGLTSFPDGVLASPAPAPAERCDGLRGSLAAPLPGARCVSVTLEGSAGRLTRGLVSGPGTDVPGRLAPPNGAATTPCPADGGTVPVTSTPVRPAVVVATTLSCYLSPGATLAQVVDDEDPEADLLRPEIYDDPRFFFVPVLNGATLPTDDGSYAVSELRGAFVTGERVDEDGATVPAECPSIDSCNGLEFVGDELYSVQLLTFPATALPSQLPQPSNGRFYPAGTKEVVLVE